MNPAREALTHHVSGAIERGEAEPITEQTAPRTIDVTPNWPGMRAWIKYVAKTDAAAAYKINEAMGCEAVPDEELDAITGRVRAVGEPSSQDFGVQR